MGVAWTASVLVVTAVLKVDKAMRGAMEAQVEGPDTKPILRTRLAQTRPRLQFPPAERLRSSLQITLSAAKSERLTHPHWSASAQGGIASLVSAKEQSNTALQRRFAYDPIDNQLCQTCIMTVTRTLPPVIRTSTSEWLM